VQCCSKRDMVPHNNKPWRRIGGGARANPTKEWPCEAIYEHVENNKCFTVKIVEGLWFDLPMTIRKPSDLTRLKGVSKEVEWRK